MRSPQRDYDSRRDISRFRDDIRFCVLTATLMFFGMTGMILRHHLPACLFRGPEAELAPRVDLLDPPGNTPFGRTSVGVELENDG